MRGKEGESNERGRILEKETVKRSKESSTTEKESIRNKWWKLWIMDNEDKMFSLSISLFTLAFLKSRITIKIISNIHVSQLTFSFIFIEYCILVIPIKKKSHFHLIISKYSPLLIYRPTAIQESCSQRCLQHWLGFGCHRVRQCPGVVAEIL